jgi:alkanesulfonate monooxygenase SsuD/methylene tetrahydromethanopterin reductase-like flavin-dependent oxidoreductase (luciferase family)
MGMIQSFIQRAEELGFHSIWVQEQIGLWSTLNALEGVSMLGYAAGLTRKILLGGAVFLAVLRNPILLAKSITSLDQLSQGRLIAGVGLGGVRRLYQAYSVSDDRLVARFNEALSLMQRLWTEEDLTFEGQFWKLKNATLLPRPIQRPHPPIWFGAHVPAALKRAAKYGSGFIGAGSSSTQNFKNEVQYVLSALEEAKKDPADFTIGKRVYLAVDANRDRAAKRLREWLGLFYRKPELADTVAVWGRPDECADQLEEIIAAGAQLLLLNPVFDMMDHLEILANEVIPKISTR